MQNTNHTVRYKKKTVTGIQPWLQQAFYSALFIHPTNFYIPTH